MFLSLLYIIKLSHLRLSHPALMPFCCYVLSHPMLSHHSRDNIYPVLSDPVTIIYLSHIVLSRDYICPIPITIPSHYYNCPVTVYLSDPFTISSLTVPSRDYICPIPWLYTCPVPWQYLSRTVPSRHYICPIVLFWLPWLYLLHTHYYYPMIITIPFCICIWHILPVSVYIKFEGEKRLPHLFFGKEKKKPACLICFFFFFFFQKMAWKSNTFIFRLKIHTKRQKKCLTLPVQSWKCLENTLIMKWKPAYDICKRFDKALDTTYAEWN